MVRYVGRNVHPLRTRDLQFVDDSNLWHIPILLSYTEMLHCTEIVTIEEFRSLRNTVELL